MFENIEDARRQILKDKHTLLEGYIPEYYFEQQFQTSIAGRYTNGWWSAIRGNQRFFFLVKEQMNSVDQRIFELLRQYECWIAYPHGDVWFFNNGRSECDENEFLRRYNFTPIRDSMSAMADTRNITRQNQCIAFFEERNIMRKIAIERNFANDFLAKYFNSMVNIDYVVQSSAGNLCVMEVKFKYENQAGNFGINIGQGLMFEKLEAIGFEIYNIILYNHTRNKDISVFGFLGLNDDKYWLYGRLFDFKNRRVSVAPRETSVYGNRFQAYYSFGKREMSSKIRLDI